MPNSDLYYLASPYTHKSETIQESRYRAACVITASLIIQGLHVYSPIAYSHGIAQFGGLRGDFQAWEALDLRILEVCTHFLIAKLYGWEDSIGLQKEYQAAEQFGLHILTWVSRGVQPLSKDDRRLLQEGNDTN